MPTATYEKIVAYTVPSAAASVTLGSGGQGTIPSTYTDLVLIINFTASTGTNNLITFNSDSNSNYSETDMGGDGTTKSSSRSTTQIGIRSGYVDSSSEQAFTIVNIQNYANTSIFKTNLIRWSSNSYVYARAGIWRNANAITSITCSTGSGTFSTGSTFTLYGIKAA